MKRVDKAEFLEFTSNYPSNLQVDICGICEPPLVTYNDFTRGAYPKSVVAQTWKYDDTQGERCYEPEENRKYYIDC
jgi:hypothetical protein